MTRWNAMSASMKRAEVIIAGRGDQGLHLGKDVRRLADRRIGDQLGRSPGSLGFEHSADRLQMERVSLGAEIDEKGHRREQQAGVEGGHVCTVSLAGLEDSHQAESSHALAKRAAGDVELQGEVFLPGQPRTGPRRPRMIMDLIPSTTTSVWDGIGGGRSSRSTSARD